jgi:hypothetical protein
MKKPAGNGQTSNGYIIGQSLRFSSAASTYFSYVFKAGGNPNAFTLSLWFKRAQINGASGGAELFSTTAGGGFDFGFGASTWSIVDKIGVLIGSGTCYKNTNAVIRDPSAWYHVVISCASASHPNGIRIYINGIEDTGNYISNNSGSWAAWNSSGSTAYLGKPYAFTNYFDGYIAEVNLIDGQTLGPSSFGQTDTVSGQWIPSAYAGTYGTNGCYLKFGDSTNLGKDSSPNGNHWTPNNFATHDQVLDSPTNNFCTLSPLRKNNVNGALPTLTAGNLCAGTQINIGSSVYVTTVGAWDLPLGKWYWEVFYTSGAGNLATGIVTSASPMPYTGAPYPVFSGTVVYTNSGLITFDDNQNYQTGLAIYGVGAVIGVAVDTTGSSNNTVTFFKNGSQVGSTQNIDKRIDWTAWAGPWTQTSESATLNFGQGGQTGLVYDAASGGRFKCTPPAGFKALCTTNLPSTMPVVTSGAFTGNANADGPFVWLGGAPTDLTINGNTVTWGTHADKLANGFKVRISSASYNAGSTNSFSATVPAKFKWATARTNP